jgi:predicted component of type VI protein secretion system
MSRVFPLIKAPGGVGPVVVGRVLAAGVDVVIADPSISKRHCLFAPDDGMVAVSDCASTHGTAVNGAPLRGGAAVRLCGGESITLGRLELTFETPAGFTELVSELGSK